VTRRSPSDALRRLRVGTVAQWQAAGLTERQLRTLVTQDALVRIRHRVYATAALVAKAKVDPRKNQALYAFAAILAAPNPGIAVASHETAAKIHGLVLLNDRPPDLVTLTRPPDRYSGPGRNTRLHAAELPPAHITKVFGVPVTTTARTVIDIARNLSYLEGVVTADSALRLGRTTKDELNAVLDRCSGWSGIAQARQVVSFSSGLSESPLESCARVAFARRGLEPPELQAVIQTEESDFRVDFYWRKYRTVAEADGLLKYRDREEGPQRAIAQLRRDRLLRASGRDVIHFTWHELFYEEDQVITRLTTSFSRPRA
jgi:very-short-patch-repair endonuclease/predicted transcriptional regulator of viral defense system